VTAALLWSAGIIAACCALLFARMSYEARVHSVTYSEVKLERLPEAFDGSRIFFISDIHKRKLSESYLRNMEGKADWVLLGGDIMERSVPLDRVRENLNILSRIGPIYAVYGNHDLKADPAGLAEALKEVGGVLLRNENVPLERAGARICLTGVDQPPQKRDGYPRLPELPMGTSDLCRIVIVHDPVWIQHVPEKNADLILAGHTHGGQIRIPLLGAIRLNRFYRKYDCGWFGWYQPGSVVRRPQMLISRGFGNRRVTLRLCCPAEMHLIQLRQAHTEKSEA